MAVETGRVAFTFNTFIDVHGIEFTIYVPAVTATLAFAKSVRDVLLAIEATVPTNTPLALVILEPTFKSVVNFVLTPATVVEFVKAVIVPVVLIAGVALLTP